MHEPITATDRQHRCAEHGQQDYGINSERRAALDLAAAWAPGSAAARLWPRPAGHAGQGATATYGLFAIVLSLLAWIYLGAVTTVICAEFNAVRVGQLWPRALLAPFTDHVQVTTADQRACTSYATTERHKSFQNINVSFGKPSQPGPAEPQSREAPSGR